jgi:hypothetical protein
LMAWVKLHTDILGDPKLMRATRKGARHLVLLPWVIAFAKHADDDGRLSVNGEPAEPDDIAQLLPGITKNQVKNCLFELQSLGILVEDAGFLAFSRWDVRAGKASDSKEATRERQRVKRDRVRGHADVTRDVTRDSRAGHSLDLEVDKEKEPEKEKDPASGADNGAGGKRPNWVGVLGDDWRNLRRGVPPYPTIGKQLKPLHDEHGSEVLRAAWLVFLESQKAQYGIPYFARNFGDFLPNGPIRSPPSDAGKRWNAGEATFRNARAALGMDDPKRGGTAA